MEHIDLKRVKYLQMHPRIIGDLRVKAESPNDPSEFFMGVRIVRNALLPEGIIIADFGDRIQIIKLKDEPELRIQVPKSGS